jgi:hypothetical protein
VTAPRGKLAGVPLGIRHLWSLLYRALRRQARAVDQLLDHVEVQRLALGEQQEALRDHRRRLDALEDDLAVLRGRVRRVEGDGGP